eukprot:Colp12_sorted_trinity150504_noHs@21110
MVVTGRYYAVQQAIKDPALLKDKAAKTYLINLMDKLEKDKKAIGQADAVHDDMVAQAHVESFALKLFGFADREDRAGRANKKVARSFYAASLVFDVLRTFGELDMEIQEKQRYAKWKAADINKCLRLGITPTPGPPTSGEELDLDENGNPIQAPGNTYEPAPRTSGYVVDNTYEEPPSASQHPPAIGGYQPPQPPMGYTYTGPSSPASYPTQPQAPYTPPAPAAQYPPTQPSFSSPYPPNQPASNTGTPRASTSQPSPKPAAPAQTKPPAAVSGAQVFGSLPARTDLEPGDFEKCSKLCRFAMSALQYEDVPTAITNLQQALAMLVRK